MTLLLISEYTNLVSRIGGWIMIAGTSKSGPF